jgi:hypothetical protein
MSRFRRTRRFGENESQQRDNDACKTQNPDGTGAFCVTRIRLRYFSAFLSCVKVESSLLPMPWMTATTAIEMQTAISPLFDGRGARRTTAISPRT